MSDVIRIIGVPMDLGQSKRGVDMGPSAIRYAGLSSRLSELGYRIEDTGNIDVPVRDTLKNDRLMQAIIQACKKVYESGKQAIAAGCFPLFIGGDHSISIGTIGGITHSSPSGLIWIDAHGDFNTSETSQTGSVHGMSLAVLNGYGDIKLVNTGRPGAKLRPKDIVMIGVRQLDEKERTQLKKSGITIYTMRDIDEQGISAVARNALKHLSHLPRIHVSLDMDSLDPKEAPGVGTPVPGGLTYREAHMMMEIIADSQSLTSMDH
jgi:arginase